jgi:hypothetical protein
MVKKIHYSLLSTFLCTALLAQPGQQDYERSIALSISPIALIFGQLDTLFQAKLLDVVSLTVPFAISYSWYASKLIEIASKNPKTKLNVTKAPIALSGGLGARIYPSGKGMTDGFYLEPRAMVSYNQFGADGSELGKVEYSILSVGPRLNLGWDWFFDSGFYTNFGLEAGYSWIVKSDVNVTQKFKDAVGNLSALPVFPNVGGKGKIEWGFEFKIGFAW